ncbi:MAG: ShlB/FhaC/HecB family hemolysin secretion/activation protein [Gammaproteobacteria bacterium]|nr:ShlB/FhaC/HecB family hemolysin secretion/activation protein [Gammaproteobacteria bacterium]
MKRKQDYFHFKKTVLCLTLTSCAFYAVEAMPALNQNQLPASTMPGVLNKILTQKPPQLMRKSPTPNVPEQESSTLGPEAQKIKFKLTKLILEGNTAYTSAEIAKIYQDKIGKEISIAELQDIIQNITNYYRNNGYILSRAILPPQKVQNGVVKVQIIEGYISGINVVGNPRGAKRMLAAYGKQVTYSRPLDISVLEKYLRLANEVPGAEVKGVLEPSKTNVGASDLNMVDNQSLINGSLSYNNYGTRYIGPQQLTASIAANSIFRSGDVTRLSYSTIPGRPKEMKFYDVSYGTYLGSHGLNWILGKNLSETLTGYTLQPLKVVGNAVTYYTRLTYPLIRKRDSSLTLDAGFDYLDSSVYSLGSLLYFDHIRSFYAGGNYNFADRYYGSNSIDIQAEHGIPGLGATTNTHSLTTSRLGGTANFTKATLQLARLQAIHGRFSAYFQFSGQYSFNALLASEQYSYGGSQLGRGYDPAEIIGDRGMGGSIELRADFAPGKYLLQAFEPYAFYDQGVIWNIRKYASVIRKQSAASAGFGIRMTFNKYLSANLFIAQPITKQVAALELLGRGRLPRGFFSLVLSG